MAAQIFSNKRSLGQFELISDLEVGIVLTGWEVKSMKLGHINMKSAYVQVSPQGELWLKGARISPYKYSPAVPREQEDRDRKLLAKKSEVTKLESLAKRPGYTLIPVEGYVNDKGLIKLVIAVAKGKKKFETKQTVKERDLQRQLRRDIKNLR